MATTYIPAAEIVKELQLSESKGVVTPGTKEEGSTMDTKDDLLNEPQAKQYLHHE